MDNIIDLDLVGRTSKKVKLNGKVIEVFAPTLEQLIEVGRLGVELQSNPGIETMAQIKKAIANLIPGLENEPINMAQLVALVDEMAKLAMPEKMDELKENGIDLAQKKIE